MPISTVPPFGVEPQLIGFLSCVLQDRLKVGVFALPFLFQELKALIVRLFNITISYQTNFLFLWFSGVLNFSRNKNRPKEAHLYLPGRSHVLKKLLFLLLLHLRPDLP